MHIRPATEDDLEHIGRIFDAASTWLIENYRPDQAGQSGFGERDRFNRHLMETGVVFLAEDPEPVGFSAAVIREGVWFLSQLWVLPEWHGKGIGSSLLDETLAWGREASIFTVVASPHPVAQLVYLRASMYPLWVQLDLVGPAEVEARPPGVELLEGSDQAWIDSLDREVRGVARPEDHELWRELATGLALRRNGSAAGYIYAWRDGKIGPGAAADPGGIPSLLTAACAAVEADSRAVAVPSSNWTALRELTRLGFKPIGSNTFMSSRPLGDPSRYISSGGGLG